MAQIKYYLIKKKGDDRIDNYFKEANMQDGKPLLNIKTIVLDSSISSYALLRRIDTTQSSVIMAPVLNETFAKKLADACYPIQKNHPLAFNRNAQLGRLQKPNKKRSLPGFSHSLYYSALQCER